MGGDSSVVMGTEVQEGTEIAKGSQGVETKKAGMWSSRAAFVFATIGSAFGLGSVWRFPYLVYEYGGLVFILLLAIFYCLIGIPVLSCEFVFGQVFQVSNCPNFNAIDRRLAGIGVGTVMVSFIICSYYNLIICWTVIYFFNSFLTDLPWSVSTSTAALCASFTGTNESACITGGGYYYLNTTSYNTSGTFTEFTDNCVWGNSGPDVCSGNILGISLAWGAKALNFGNPFDPEAFSWQILVAFIIVWTVQFTMLSMGPKVLGYMLYVTMTLPMVMMIALLIIAVTLPGAGTGIQAYIGKWEGSVFSTEPEIWSQAASQCFFSLSLCEGSMMTYGAYSKRSSPCGQDSVIVVAATMVFSILAGFAVFGIIGYLSYTSGIPVADLPLTPSNALAFQTLPVGAASLAYPLAQIVCVLFFFMLFMLGTSSSVSMIEPFLNMIKVSRFGANWKRWKVTGSTFFFLFVIDLVFCVDFGIYLETAINNFTTIGLLGNGVAELFAFAWMYNREVSFSKVGQKATWVFMGIYVGGTSIGAIVLGFRYLPSIIAGGVIMVVCAISSFFVGYWYCSGTTADGSKLSPKEKMFWLFVGPAEITRCEFNSIMGCGMKWWMFNKFTFIWTLLCRFILPPALMMMVAAFIAYPGDWVSTTQPAWYNIVGALVTIILDIGAVVVFSIFPQWIESFSPESCVALIPSIYPAGYDEERPVSTVDIKV